MARRGHGEGSISHRADGRWEGRLDLGWSSGRRKRKLVYGRTRAEVVKKLRELARQRDEGTLVEGRSVKLRDFMKQWLESVESSLRPSTFRTYRIYVEHHLIPELGHVNVEKLTAAQVQAMLARELTRGMSPQTVVHLRAILRRAMNRALRFGMVSRNVVALTDPPKVEKDDLQVLDVAQAQAFLEAARHDRLRGLYTLALLTGLRQGELLGLRWQDVDLDGAQLHVSHSLQRHGGKRQLVPPKTGGSVRTVVIPALAVEALREHRACQVEERLFAGPQWEEWGVVFATRRGTPLEPGNVVRSFKRVLRAANLPDMRFHDLRHSCATLLLVQGVAPRVVMEILGHSQISLTMNTYSHVVPAVQQEAAARLDKLVRRPSAEAAQE